MSRLSLFKDENCFESCAAVNHPYLIFNPGMTLLSVSWMSLFSVASNFVFFHTSKLFFSRFHSLESREINAIYLRVNAGTNSSHAHTHDARNVNFSNCVRNKRFGFVTITDAGFGFWTLLHREKRWLLLFYQNHCHPNSNAKCNEHFPLASTPSTLDPSIIICHV